MNRDAILVVSFGTSYAASREAAILPVELELAAAFPGFATGRAFTSAMIRRVMEKRDGILVDDVRSAALRLAESGCKHLLCQPTHIINGVENDEMHRALASVADRFGRLAVGAPLLSADADYIAVVEAVYAELSPAPDTALILMGHGTCHYANASYAALDYRFHERGYRNVFVGAVEGYPGPEIALRLAQEAGYRKALLAPLMLVAGDHARNDMAGEEPDSWNSLFTRAGFVVETRLKGLGEYPAIRALYLEHARAALLEEKSKYA